MCFCERSMHVQQTMRTMRMATVFVVMWMTVHMMQKMMQMQMVYVVMSMTLLITQSADPIQMGCVACYAIAPMSAEQVKRTSVLHTLSLARNMGDAV